MKRKLTKLLAAVLAGAMLLAGCTTTGGSNAGSGKVLNLVNQQEPGALHPSLAQGTHDSFPLDHMFEGLYVKSPEGGVELGAASEAKQSEDGLTWTFTINKDGKWSNGDPVTAHDFVTSYKFCIDPANAAQYASQLYIFENAEAINNGEKGVDELGVKALDDYTLEVKLAYNLPYLPDYLCHYTFYPVHTKTQQEHPDWANSAENYVSNGPFVLTEWKNKESLTLSKNKNYRRAADVKLDQLHFNIIEDIATSWQKFQQGELDAVYPLPGAVLEQLRNENDSKLHIFDDLSTYYYHFNVERKPFNNVKVRQALSMSIDRQAICDSVTKGGEEPAYTVTSPGITDEKGGDFQQSIGQLFTEDVEAAKTLLAEGLAEEGMTADEFTFVILYNTLDSHRRVAEAIQAMWKQNLGINVELENTEFQVALTRRAAGDYDVARAGWIGDYADPMTFIELTTSWSEFNHSHWYNDDYDALVKSAMVNTDPVSRMDQLRQAETIMVQEMPIMPIYYYTKPWVIQDNVTGYFTPVNRFVNFSFADKTEA